MVAHCDHSPMAVDLRVYLRMAQSPEVPPGSDS